MNITEHPKIDLNLSFTINEKEAKALDALVGYDFNNFLKVFKTNLGEHYMNGHEETLKEIFYKFRNEISPALSKLETARKVFNK